MSILLVSNLSCISGAGAGLENSQQPSHSSENIYILIEFRFEDAIDFTFSGNDTIHKNY